MAEIITHPFLYLYCEGCMIICGYLWGAPVIFFLIVKDGGKEKGGGGEEKENGGEAGTALLCSVPKGT